jgi:Txe/YoeB family toxin of Txe-Axe toxin-antitoxin module
MKLSEHSQARICQTFKHWSVDSDFSDPIYNYLVFGFSPGSCFTSVLANDFFRAVQRSHPANTITAFKNLSGWILDTMPKQAFGTYAAVEQWLELTAEERRKVLEEHRLIYTQEEEMILILSGKPTEELV